VEERVVTASLRYRELSALRLMKNGTEFVYCSREGWVGSRRIAGARTVLLGLIRKMLVRQVSMPGCEGEYYRIGPEGLAALEAASLEATER
jgi:hypothetical protein